MRWQMKLYYVKIFGDYRFVIDVSTCVDVPLMYYNVVCHISVIFVGIAHNYAKRICPSQTPSTLTVDQV